jgi:hypothetical protein
MKQNEVESIIGKIEELSESFQDILTREPVGDDGKLENLSSITFKIFGQDVERLGEQMKKFLDHNFGERDQESDQQIRKALGLEP